MTSPVTVSPGDTHEALDANYVESQGWGDGLPVVAPTPELVGRMMAAVGRSAADVVATLPPAFGDATTELVAVNAVMAGCRPAEFPLVVRAVEALGDPRYNLLGVNTTTNPVTPLVIVNGPVRRELGMNVSYGVLGPGGPGPAIARAVSLVMINVAGRIPGGACQAAYKLPGGALCAAEYEEMSPWEPLHVERGLDPGASAVTVTAISGMSNLVDIWAKTGEELALNLSNMMSAQVGTNWIRTGDGVICLMLNPHHARLLSQAFPEKRQFKEFLHENCRVPLSLIGPRRTELLKERGCWHADDRGQVVTERPDQWQIFVAGGLGGYHSCHLHTFTRSDSVTLAI